MSSKRPTSAPPNRLDRRLHELIHGRLRDDRGATMVEYSLIFALIVVGGVGTTKYLATKGGSQVATQSNCLASRPPPTTCVLPVVTQTTVGPSLSTTTSTTSPPQPVGTATSPTGGTVSNGKVSGVSITLTRTLPNGPITNGVAVFRIAPSPDPTTGASRPAFDISVNCTAAGVCTLPSTDIPTGGTFTVVVKSVTGTPAPPTPNGTRNCPTTNGNCT